MIDNPKREAQQKILESIAASVEAAQMRISTQFDAFASALATKLLVKK